MLLNINKLIQIIIKFNFKDHVALENIYVSSNRLLLCEDGYEFQTGLIFHILNEIILFKVYTSIMQSQCNVFGHLIIVFYLQLNEDIFK